MVTAMYHHGTNVGAENRAHFFDIPLQERLKTNTATTLLEWQRSSQKALKQAIKDFQKNAAHNQITLFGQRIKSAKEKAAARDKP